MSAFSQSCYISWTESKSGIPIPLYANGKAAASIYNPEQEALRFASLDVFKNAGFILIAGLGARLHINELTKRYPDRRIAAVEANKASADFIVHGKSGGISYAKTDICTADTVYDFLLQNYFPPVDGDFCLYPLRSWADYQPELFERIKTETERALKDIAADISTQARFGKIWHKNIMDNLSLYADMPSSSRVDFFKSRFPVHKTAFVAGAGPTLESCFPILKRNREAYYIIATDTAFRALNARGIQPDVFVSIDPQQVSVHHLHTRIKAETLFVCDTSCSPLVPRKALDAGAKILFFNSNHPLCLLTERYYAAASPAASSALSPLFPFFASSEGTVTIAAVNFALKAGFTKIATGGADFCYTDGKAYTCGSYFDALFGSISTRLNSAEHLFCNLMYAKTLEYDGTINGIPRFTTELLKAYRKSFDKLCAQHPNMIFPLTEDDNRVPLHAENVPEKNNQIRTAFYCEDIRRFNAKEFAAFYKTELTKLQKGIKTDFTQDVYTSLLPYAAYFTARHGFFDLQKIVHEIVLKFRY